MDGPGVRGGAKTLPEPAQGSGHLGGMLQQVPVQGVGDGGRAFDEATLISIASGFEAHTDHRGPPASTPPLPEG